ncbi:MAG: malto-oligosyltrehalose synthase [Mycobacteriaceae bacterium]
MTAVLSTYRLQLHGPDADGHGPSLTLSDAADLVGQLDALGVSHLYASPILTAARGSQHGYDVVDPTSVSSALGGSEALEQLVGALRERGMGLVVDIVPNHVGVATPAENAWWWDVLRQGADSPLAELFDVDFSADNGCDGRIALPVLGSAADVEHLQLVAGAAGPELHFYDHRFPVGPGTEHGTPQQVHERQAYRLVPWQDGLVGYRRFFHVNTLAALRQEDPRVFETTHAEVARWAAEDLVDGIRVDHPDGLADPAGYLHRLRDVLGPDRWLVVEKILATDEALDPTLPVDGTTGYDALREIGGVFVDPAGESSLGRLSLQRTGTEGDAADLAVQEHELKRGVARAGLRPELERCVRAVERAGAHSRADGVGSDVSHEHLVEAVVELVAAVPVYRSDYPSLAGLLPGVMARVAASHPELEPALSEVGAALVARGEAATRFQQVCGAVTAKGVEDCLFYRTTRLTSLQEVGGDPGRFGVSPAELHLAAAERARFWPASMTTLSTHDTKRGEDVRARIHVLSEVADLWSESVAAFEQLAPSPDGAMGSLLWQTMFGVWPADGRSFAEVPDLRERLHAYAEKAVREAGTRTEWNAVDTAWEAQLHTWLDAVIDGPVAAGMDQLVSRLAPVGWSNSLGQKLLHLLGPGVPDVYQGTELWEDSLVDPDNRREVDHEQRLRLLAELGTLHAAPPVDASGLAKLKLVAAALRLRRDHPDAFLAGSYTPVLAQGPQAQHLVGFARGDKSGPRVIALATRLSMSLTSWDTTTVDLPEGTWTDRLSGAVHRGRVQVATVLSGLPVAALVRG